MQMWRSQFGEARPAVHALQIKSFRQVLAQQRFQRVGVVKQILEKSFALGAHYGVGILALGQK